ncbi:MAG: tetratricopeptide repeat protein [Prevotella sp.]|nr:tetratricopeptide repeat protein [Prevotella sp.]
MKKTGDEYFDSQEFRDMLANYEESINAGLPVLMDADELADIADYYQMSEELDKAEEAITLALSLAPGSIAPITYRIHEALFNGDTQTAWEWLDQIIEKSEPDYIYDRAEILIAEGKVDEADRFLREEFKKVPADEYQDYVIDVAHIYSDYGQSEKAMEWMVRAHHEDSLDYQELMGRTLFGLGKYKDSEQIFSKLIDHDPFSKRYWNALASAQFMEEDYPGSIQSSEYAIAIDPKDPDGLMAKANGLFRLNNYEEALKYYERYSEQIPDDEFALLYQGTCLANMGQSKKAIEKLEQALRMAGWQSPYYNDIVQELAFTYGENGQLDKGLALLNETDEVDCDHVQMELVKGHLLLSVGRLTDAEMHFRTAVSICEDFNEVFLRIIVSLYDNRYLEAAHKLYEKYFAMSGKDNKTGYAYMALCCYDLKRYDEFLAYLKRACEVNPFECRSVLSHLFPEDVKPEQYYEYIKDKLTQ